MAEPATATPDPRRREPRPGSGQGACAAERRAAGPVRSSGRGAGGRRGGRQLPFIVYFLRGDAPTTVEIGQGFSDDFERDQVGANYFTTGGLWRIEKGVLHSPGAKNNPLWLKARLPADVAVEFDVRSESNEGDIKCEIFGNGRDHASGYVVLFGGWSNSTSALARRDEHGRDRKENRSLRVTKGKTYRFKVQRKGTLLQWFADGNLMLEWDDPEPLRGSGHDRFGFSSWEADLYFDNLKITPL
jgi:hypothetical protein